MRRQSTGGGTHIWGLRPAMLTTRRGCRLCQWDGGDDGEMTGRATRPTAKRVNGVKNRNGQCRREREIVVLTGSISSVHKHRTEMPIYITGQRIVPTRICLPNGGSYPKCSGGEEGRGHS